MNGFLTLLSNLGSADTLGESVRWSRVRRLVSAYTASGGGAGVGGGGSGGGGGGGGAGKGGGGGGGFTAASASTNRGRFSAAAAVTAETFEGLAEGAQEVVLTGLYQTQGDNWARRGVETWRAEAGDAGTRGAQSGGAGTRGRDSSSDAGSSRSEGAAGGGEDMGVEAVAEAVHDAADYVMSPAGAPLRANLVRDALDSGQGRIPYSTAAHHVIHQCTRHIVRHIVYRCSPRHIRHVVSRFPIRCLHLVHRRSPRHPPCRCSKLLATSSCTWCAGTCQVSWKTSTCKTLMPGTLTLPPSSPRRSRRSGGGAGCGGSGGGASTPNSE